MVSLRFPPVWTLEELVGLLEVTGSESGRVEWMHYG